MLYPRGNLWNVREGYESAERIVYTLVVSNEVHESAYMKPNKEPIACLRGYMRGKPLEIPSSHIGS
mgnify:CR=1 FL=1